MSRLIAVSMDIKPVCLDSPSTNNNNNKKKKNNNNNNGHQTTRVPEPDLSQFFQNNPCWVALLKFIVAQ